MSWTFRRGAALAAAWIAMIAGATPSSRAFAQTLPSDLAARMKDANQWPMAARDYANTRYSELDQINTSNASQLQLAWTFSVGADRGQEAAPLIVDGTMYVVGPYDGPYPNRVFALDATTGELKWSYAPRPEPAAKGVACCDVVNRGLAFDRGKIFLNTLDVHTVALDATTGKELWHNKLGEINRGETVTMAPVVVNGKVLVGNSGG
jgi:lanthanide-dependent methanol dehydrogenase